MDKLSPQEIEKLILGYEDLDPEDQALADRYLSQHPDLAARLKWHQDLESRSRRELPLAETLGDVPPLSPEEMLAQQESLRRILARLETESQAAQGPDARGGKVISLADRLRRQALWALPLAAILALAILLPRGAEDKLLMQNLTITRVELMADGTRGPEFSVPDGTELHTGEAFALDFFLPEDAYVAVFHVDPRGQVSRVFPESITDGLVPLRGGQGHQIPQNGGGEVWVLGSETGTETFLLATSTRRPDRLDQVVVDAGGTDRQAVLEDLKSQLESLADLVEMREFEHLD